MERCRPANPRITLRSCAASRFQPSPSPSRPRCWRCSRSASRIRGPARRSTPQSRAATTRWRRAPAPSCRSWARRALRASRTCVARSSCSTCSRPGASPASAEAPILEQEERTLVKHDATVLGVTYLDNSSDSEQFVRQHGITYPVVRDVSGNFVKGFGTTGVPETFVINRQGRIVALRRYQLAGKLAPADDDSDPGPVGMTRTSLRTGAIALLIALMAAPLALAPAAATAAAHPPRVADRDRERRDVHRLPRAAGGGAVAGGQLRARVHPRADRSGRDQVADPQEPRRPVRPCRARQAAGARLQPRPSTSSRRRSWPSARRSCSLRFRAGGAARERAPARRPRRSKPSTRRTPSGSTKSSASSAAEPARAPSRRGSAATPRRCYIESGALTPSSPSDSAIVVCAATDSATRCDSTASGVAPTT